MTKFTTKRKNPLVRNMAGANIILAVERDAFTTLDFYFPKSHIITANGLNMLPRLAKKRDFGDIIYAVRAKNVLTRKNARSPLRSMRSVMTGMSGYATKRPQKERTDPVTANAKHAIKPKNARSKGTAHAFHLFSPKAKNGLCFYLFCALYR